MKNLNKIKSVLERDIDLLLLEEFNVSYEFAYWFYKTIVQNESIVPIPLCQGAWHSISQAHLGESDLIILYDNGLAILIENKINASTQPEQGLRYKARGHQGILDKSWKRFITCIIAPDLYLQKEQDVNIYETNISYEILANWFKQQGKTDPRLIYKSYLIKEAIEQNRRGYTITPNKNVTTFWTNYWDFANTYYPQLEMKKPGIKPANSDWPDFRPTILKKGLLIIHKLERGNIDLQIANAADKIEKIKQYIKDNNIEIVTAGKSAAIRLKVKSIDRFSSFELQKNMVIDGLNAANKLLEIAKCLPEDI